MRVVDSEPLISFKADAEEARARDWLAVNPRALGTQRLWKAMVQALYACLARALSSACGGGVEGQYRPSHRLYRCRRCGVFVCVCRRCDRGQCYCPGGCAGVSRRESLRAAGRRYQRSRRGAQHHAARQRRYCLRRACQKI